jgi:hypothetical protein
VQTTSRAISGGVNWAGSAAAWTASASYTIDSDNSTGNDCFVQSRALSAAGSEDPGAVSGGGGGNDGWNGFTVTITDAGGGGGAAPTPRLSLLGVGN